MLSFFPPNSRQICRAFSLIEVLTATAIVGIVFVSLYLGLANGFGVIQLTRENLRATQILQEKCETIRLYTWEQISSNGFIPTNFLAYYYPNTNRESVGLTYTGTVTIADSRIPESYGTNIKLIRVQLGWKSGEVERSREMETFISRYGLQNYIY